MLQAILSLLLVFIAALGVLSAAAPPPRQRLQQPNIVVIFTDDQEITSLPNMPYLMSQPEGSWIHFNNAFVNDAICTPSRASMLTGQYSVNHGIVLNGQGGELDDSNTVATWLDDAGYTTALFGKYSNGYPWNNGSSWKPAGWDEFNGTLGNTVQITETAVDFLESVDGPFFLNVNYRAPHYSVSPSAAYKNADVLIPPRSPSMPEEDTSDKPAWVQALRMSESTLNAIDGRRTVSYRTLLDVDDGVEAVMETLKAQGQLDDTVIIYLSDHGFSFGAHNWERKHCPYEECHRIPFMIRYPGLPGSRDDSRYVSIVDVVPTIAELAGVTPGLPQDGRSLVPLLDQPGPSVGRCRLVREVLRPQSDLCLLWSTHAGLEVHRVRHGRAGAVRSDGRSVRAGEPCRAARLCRQTGGDGRRTGGAVGRRTAAGPASDANAHPHHVPNAFADCHCHAYVAAPANSDARTARLSRLAAVARSLSQLRRECKAVNRWGMRTGL